MVTGLITDLAHVYLQRFYPIAVQTRQSVQA